jgi:hypothetical protein
MHVVFLDEVILVIMAVPQKLAAGTGRGISGVSSVAVLSKV